MIISFPHSFASCIYGNDLHQCDSDSTISIVNPSFELSFLEIKLPWERQKEPVNSEQRYYDGQYAKRV
jgi:hypothetical protein